jgi:hypothetical protein
MNATPGPWIFVGAPEGATADYIIAEHREAGDVVATVIHPMRSGTAEANARLIAAAPDLLAVALCVDADVSRGETCPACARSPHAENCYVPAAVAKAVGR